MKDAPVVYGIGPASRAIGCGVDWLRDHVDDGSIPAYRDPYGRRILDDKGLEIGKRLYVKRRAMGIAGRRHG